MHRFFYPSSNITHSRIVINDKEQAHHIKDVLRLKVKDAVTVFDDKGNEYIGAIEKLLPQSIILKIKDKHILMTAKQLKITVACAIPKKSKMDDIVDKLTQLGVDRVIPLLTERVIVKWDKQKKMLQQKRWEKIALCASQQSQRNILPIIEPIKDVKEVLSESEGFDLKLIPTLTGERESLKEIFAKSKPKNILVLIGSEGDFTPREVELAKKFGCIPVTLGDLVLRVETAAIAVASILNYILSY